MHAFVTVLPLLVILVLLLPPFRFHILVAGLAGGVLAAIVGGLDVAKITELYLKGLSQMLSITSVAIFAATAMVLARLGATQACLKLIQRVFKGRLAPVAAAMVLVQAAAVYVAGCGAANTLVTAPLINSVVGFVPHVVAGLSIVSGATWATSPASAESAYISKAMGIQPGQYAEFMRPFTFAFWIIGAALAWYGVWRYSRAGKLSPSVSNGSGRDSGAPQEESLGSVVRRALPFLLLLLLILIGPPVNRAVGATVFSTATTPLIVLVVAAIACGVRPNKLCEMLIDGSVTILRYLFLVGLFLGFINLLGEIGTFKTLASLAGSAPASLIVAAALVMAFLIAVPSAAYTVAIDALIIPVLAAAGVPVWAFGFVGIAVAQGAMISPAQINVAATAHGFQTDIMRIIKNNLPYMPAALLITILMATVFLR
ncbi:MAG: hypothetical protein H5T92_02135 [Synergistales bacterium]|nr:hypothetical protein [Synergistales bacterium]